MTCFEQSASPAELVSYRHFQQVIRTGKCQYCGAPAVSGSRSCGIPGVMEEETQLWCEQCRQDLAEFSRRAENATIEDFDVEHEARLEQMSRQLAERQRSREEFMRHRLKARDHDRAG